MQGIALVKWVKGMQNEMVKVLMLCASNAKQF